MGLTGFIISMSTDSRRLLNENHLPRNMLLRNSHWNNRWRVTVHKQKNQIRDSMSLQGAGRLAFDHVVFSLIIMQTSLRTIRHWMSTTVTATWLVYTSYASRSPMYNWLLKIEKSFAQQIDAYSCHISWKIARTNYPYKVTFPLIVSSLTFDPRLSLLISFNLYF